MGLILGKIPHFLFEITEVRRESGEDRGNKSKVKEAVEKLMAGKTLYFSYKQGAAFSPVLVEKVVRILLEANYEVIHDEMFSNYYLISESKRIICSDKIVLSARKINQAKQRRNSI